MTVAALFVQTGGVYFDLPGVDPWDEARDARTYAGPHRVVTHPPCARWCRLAGLVEARTGGRLRRGDDDGCFASALASVRRWGGVLEHPFGSSAWPAFGLLHPHAGAWTRSLLRPDEWVTSVDQHHYGHRARKRTWLLLVGEPRPLNWTEPHGLAPVYQSWAGRDQRGSRSKAGMVEVMCKRERSATPRPFAELLLSLARGTP